MCEEALEQRVVAGMHVADDGEAVAGDDRRLVTCRELDVDRMEDRSAPRRFMVGERRSRASSHRLRVGVAQKPAQAALQLGNLVVECPPWFHQLAHDVEEHRHEGAAAVWD
jgi:hypothetical protein